MGCSFGLKTPYEECALLLREYQLLLRKRKDNIYTKNVQDKIKLDNSVKSYKTKIYDNLKEIHDIVKSDLEISKLKYLNSVFQVLLTEESEIYKGKKEDKADKEKLDKEEKQIDKDVILIDND